MAVYLNPQYYEGPLMSLVKIRAKDGQTWQPGHFVRTTDSGIVKCKSEATSIVGLTAELQNVATASSDVWINRINSTSTKFLIGVTRDGADAKIGLSAMGGNWGLGVNSCVCTLSLSNDSDEVLRVHDLLSRVEPIKNDTSDEPGFAIVSVTAAALDAEGAGV